MIYESALKHGLINSYSDLEITTERGFKDKAREASKLFESHYTHLEELSNDQLIRVLRYFMGKAAERCIADELYASDDKRICNITYLLSDVDSEYFGINIPAHYMFELSDLSMHYLMPLKEYIERGRSEKNIQSALTSSIIHWQIIAYTHAYLRKAYKAHGHYENSSIKTLDEIRITAFKALQQKLLPNGWEIEKMNYLLSSPWSIIGRYKDQNCAMLFRTNHGYFNERITIEELEKLVDFAEEHKDKNYSIGYILAKIESSNKQHNKDQVIITGDNMKFDITDFKLYRK
jgi:hypothetical protein